MFEKIIEMIAGLLGRLFGGDTQTKGVESKPVTGVKKPSEPAVVNEEKAENETAEPKRTVIEEKKNPAEGYVILVDNGHGMETKGKRSPWCATKTKPEIVFYEWSWNRKAATAIVERLKAEGYDARLIVTEEYDVTLAERCKRVNKVCSSNGAKKTVLMSIHANAAGNGAKWMTGRGWSAYTTRGKTGADDLCEFLYKAAEKYFMGMKIRRDKTDGDSDIEADFYILKHTKCPAILSENFFYDNVDDVRYILSDEGLENVVKTHVEGVKEYLNSIISK